MILTLHKQWLIADGNLASIINNWIFRSEKNRSMCSENTFVLSEVIKVAKTQMKKHFFRFTIFMNFDESKVEKKFKCILSVLYHYPCSVLSHQRTNTTDVHRNQGNKFRKSIRTWTYVYGCVETSIYCIWVRKAILCRHRMTMEWRREEKKNDRIRKTANSFHIKWLPTANNKYGVAFYQYAWDSDFKRYIT